MARMARSEFKLIANLLKETKASKGQATIFGKGLKGTNPRFDFDKFMNAIFGKTK